MAEIKRTLKDEVEAVFRQACEENDMQVAEHLLQALETLARRNALEGDVDRLYLEIATCLHPRAPH